MSKRESSDNVHTHSSKAARMSDGFTPQTSNVYSLSNDPNNLKKSITTKQHAISTAKKQSAKTKQVMCIIQKSEPRSTIHGELYNTYLTISIILHEFKKQNNFIVATEVSEAGKFDDIIYHCQSPTGTNTLYIQAKHKHKSGNFITEKDLCAVNGNYSIPTYFLSFIAIDPKLSGGEDEIRKDEHKTRYALCTNADLHANVKHYFTEMLVEEDDSLQFCDDVGATCYQFRCDIPSLLVVLKKSYKDKLKTDAEFDKQKDEFFRKFLLICNSCNQEELRKTTGNLLPSWCDEAQRVTVIDKLEALLNNNVYSIPRYYKDLERMQKWFLEIDLNQNISDLKRSSKEFLELIHEKHPHIEMKMERIKEMNLYSFLQDTSSFDVFEFNSTLDLTVSSRILFQVLSLLQFETLFIDSTKYAKMQEVNDILVELLSYLRDVNHPIIKVVTILGKHDHVSIHEIKKLSEKYCRKIVVVKKFPRSTRNEEAERKDEERILVKDLSDEFSKQLYHQTELRMFGTHTPLSSIVKDTDDLSFLLDVLEPSEQWSHLKDQNLNENNYEKIKQLYVGRHVESYEQEGHMKIAHVQQYVSDPKMQNAPASKTENTDTPEFLEGYGGKVCIFLNDAGLGKTTYFTWLAWRLSTLHPSLYVIKFNAMEYSNDFDRLIGSDIKNLDNTNIIQLLYRIIHLALFVTSINSRKIDETDVVRNQADRCAKLLKLSNERIILDETEKIELSVLEIIEMRLFQEKFNHRKLVLILDGFDEIAPYYKDVVMNCFARFARFDGVQSLYLSSRPYGFENELKSTFDQCRMFRLKPFTENDIELSFDKFLLNNLNGYKDYEQQYRNNILKMLYNIISDVLKDVISVPLLLYMVQVILLPKIKNHVNEQTNTLSDEMLSNANLDSLHLVEKFIDRKIEILTTDKAGTTDSAGSTAAAKRNYEKLKKVIKEQHMLLAMCVIFDRKDREKLLTRMEQDRADEIMEEVNEGGEKTGIVLGVQNGVPQFLHRTFAEYFSACWLYKNLESFKTESIFRSQTIWSSSLRETREYLDRLILRESKDCELHLAVLNKSRARIKEILYNNPSAVAVKDNVGRLPLHLLHYLNDLYDLGEDIPAFQSILNKLHEVKLLLKCASNEDREFINQKDKLYGWNALDYPFAANEVYLIKELFTGGITPNMDNLFKQVCSNTIDILLMKENEYCYFFVECMPGKDYTEELSVRVAEYLIEDKRIDIFSPLAELNSLSVMEKVITEGNVSLFIQLIKKTNSQALGSGDHAKRLLQCSLKKKTDEITISLVEHHFPLVSMIHDNKTLIACAESAIKKNQSKLFKLIFKQFSNKNNIACVEEDKIVIEFGDQDENETSGIEILFLYSCCLKPPPKTPECNVERLLYVAINCGNIQMASYILQSSNMEVTIELVEKIMHQTRRKDVEKNNHKNCIPAFKYLFKKIKNKDRQEGDDQVFLDLFLMSIKHGCLYMLHSLTAIGFNPNNINIMNHWNVFQNRLLNSDEQYSANICVYLQQQSYLDCFVPFDSKGESVFDKAIIEKRFIVAQALVQDKFSNLSISDKENVVLDLLHQQLLKHGMELIIEMAKTFLEKSATENDEMENAIWHSVYSTICQQKLDRLHLVERLVFRKIENLTTYITEPTNSVGTTVPPKENESQLKKEIKEQHIPLAIYYMFDSKEREVLLSKEEQKWADEIIEKMKQNNKKTEIILGVENGVPQFTHRIYAEYLTACWLYENMERFKSESIFRSQTIWSSSLRETREYLDRLILRESVGCELHLALVNKSYAQIKQILQENPSAVTVTDKVGRLPLHLLHYVLVVNEDKGTLFYRSILNKVDEIKQLLKYVPNGDREFLNEKDKLYGWNALDYAFVLNERDLIYALFIWGVMLNMDILCQHVCSNVEDVLLKQVNEYKYIFVEFMDRKDLADELSEGVKKNLIENKQTES